MNCHYSRFQDSVLVQLASLCAVVVVIGMSAWALRHPIAPSIDPLATIEIKRQLLAGSDALLERGVIPPNISDWIFMDCDKKSASARAVQNTRRLGCN